jgi:ribosome-dependent ATPase
MHLSVAAFNKGLSFPELTRDLIALTLFGPLLVAIAAGFLKKQEA